MVTLTKNTSLLHLYILIVTLSQSDCIDLYIEGLTPLNQPILRHSSKRWGPVMGVNFRILRDAKFGIFNITCIHSAVIWAPYSAIPQILGVSASSY